MHTLDMQPVACLKPRELQPVAPWRHTVILIVVFTAVAVAGAISQGHIQGGAAARHPDAVPLYGSLILMEWGLVAYVWRGGLRRSGTSLRAVIGGRSRGVRDIAVDLALAVVLWGGWTLLDHAWDRWLGAAPGSTVEHLRPHGGVEAALWIALSMSAGFAEELVFRGYFLRQFAALTGRTDLAIVLQALLFGIGHGYQGAAACLRIAVYGLFFGGLAVWRRSLRPGMAAHALTDIIAGLM